MDNNAIADNFSLLSKLMDINGENSFKTKTYSIAAYHIEKLPLQLKDTPGNDLAGIKGIGASVAGKITEQLETGQLQVLNDYLQKTPPGVVEMLNIKGIGPKKINTIWKEMEIESIGELLYACNENRLTLFKGFGAKTQQNVQEAIEFYLQNQESHLYASVYKIYPAIKNYLENLFSPEKVQVTGSYRRQSVVIDELEFVIAEKVAAIKPKFETAYPPELLEETDDSLLYKLKNGLKLRLYSAEKNLIQRLFLTTGTKEFNEAFQKAYPSAVEKSKGYAAEEMLFKEVDLPFIHPCLRESVYIIGKVQKNNLPELIIKEDIKGIIHNHSNWSDGTNTIEEMANTLISKGIEYLVISDHSKAAFYANGLSEEKIREQHKYIDELNEKFKTSSGGKQPFKIFKSIECDILNDGSPDYSNEVLSTFDLVITSVHSNLKMTEEKAMTRLLKAISNPYTTILGHMTGRLLLSRNGYPVNHTAIIDACAANHVVIELNAHPRRLDIDWQWINQAVEKGVLISINPDAHNTEGFDDIQYGVLAAQKGCLTKKQNLSCFSLTEFENYLLKIKTLKGI
jgi:DNA polymerase (family X)